MYLEREEEEWNKLWPLYMCICQSLYVAFFSPPYPKSHISVYIQLWVPQLKMDDRPTGIGSEWFWEQQTQNHVHLRERGADWRPSWLKHQREPSSLIGRHVKGWDLSQKPPTKLHWSICRRTSGPNYEHLDGWHFTGAEKCTQSGFKRWDQSQYFR